MRWGTKDADGAIEDEVRHFTCMPPRTTPDATTRPGPPLSSTARFQAAGDGDGRPAQLRMMPTSPISS